jgi:hypothetical protein
LDRSGKPYHSSGAGRNPFPDEPFYFVPIKLHDCGLAGDMTGAEFKRYCTFLRLANYHKRNEFRATLNQLKKVDRISARRAHEIHPRLEERGMILVERNTDPYTYVVLHPSEWRDRKTKLPYPASKIPGSYLRNL